MKKLKLYLLGLGLVLAGTCEVLATISPNQEKVIQGHNEFALDLYRQLQSGEGNIFFSPLSISTALSMSYGGARGQTAAEMAQVLHLPADLKTLHSGNHALLEMLSTNKEFATRVAVANRLWPAKGMQLKAPFLNLCQSNYGALPQTLDFAGQTENARLTINDWAEDNTEGMIQNLLNKGDLSAQTQLVLTNAIFFKGSWVHEFDPQKTRQGSFHVDSDHVVQANFMKQTKSFPYTAIEGAQLVQLPYQYSNLVMLIILPDRGRDLAEFEAQLDGEHFGEWVKALRKQQVELTIPRFEMSQRLDLAKTLAMMGMVEAFTGRADFSGMTDAGIFIDQVYHQAKLVVDEEGTEAAAATAVVMEKAHNRLYKVQADRPFLVLIRDASNGSILFLGRVMDPGW